MVPDWVLLILLFIGIAFVPLYNPAMTPFEYFAGGLSNLFQSVGAFIGLILLAIVLLVAGATLLVGYETVRGKFTKDEDSLLPENDEKTEKASDPLDIHYPPPPNASASTVDKRSMRPYRVAKSRHLGSDDRLVGVLLVIAGLALLWIIPGYLFSSSKESKDVFPPSPPPYSGDGSYSHREKVGDSKPGQAVLGGLALVVLLLSFAFMKPEKHQKKDQVGKEKPSSAAT